MLENFTSSSSFVGTAVLNMGRKSQGVCALPEVWKEQDGFAHSIQVVAEGQRWAQGSVFPVVHLEKKKKQSHPWEAKIGERKIKFGWLRLLG